MFKNCYRITDSGVELGSHEVIPSGFLSYTPGQEPQELLDARVTEAKDAKLAEIMQNYGDAFASIKKVYPAAEREGWPEQKAEALALMDNHAAPTPVLSTLVVERGKGETVAQLA